MNLASEETKEEVVNRVKKLIQEMISREEEGMIRERDQRSNPFPGPSTSSSALPSPLIAIDHCFSVKGKGSVMTGSVLNGEIKWVGISLLSQFILFRVGAEIEIGVTKERRKVKELQSWREGRDKVSSFLTRLFDLYLRFSRKNVSFLVIDSSWRESCPSGFFPSISN